MHIELIVVEGPLRRDFQLQILKFLNKLSGLLIVIEEILVEFHAHSLIDFPKILQIISY